MRIGLIPTISDWNVTFALNRDLAPGGVSTQVADADYYNIGFLFSFVPTYSAIDFQGAINSDGDMFLANAVSAPSPFSRIYGNNLNDRHVAVDRESFAWETLFSEQFGMNGNSPGCPAPVSNYPPVPYFQAPDQMCGYDQASFQADGTFSGINLTYSWVIRIMTGPNADQVVSTGSGPIYNLAANNYPPGMYEVTCTCWYPNHPGATSSYARTISINQNCGGGGRMAAEPGPEPETSMQPYPNPSTGLVRIDLALEPGETGRLFLRSSSGNSLAERSVVGNGQVERYSFDLGNAPGSLYLLELNTNRRRLTRKVLVTRLRLFAMKNPSIFFLGMMLLLGAVAACNPPLLGPKERQWLQTEVTGTVMLEDGTPIDSIMIIVAGRRGGPAFSSFKDTLIATLYSDPNGTFALQKMFPTDFGWWVNAIPTDNRRQYNTRFCNGTGNPCEVVVGQKNTAQFILFKR